MKNQITKSNSEEAKKSKTRKMTTNLQQGTLLDVLKKKMRQTKEEMERFKDECEDYNRKLQLEMMRREEVSPFDHFLLIFISYNFRFKMTENATIQHSKLKTLMIYVPIHNSFPTSSSSSYVSRLINKTVDDILCVTSKIEMRQNHL